MLNKIKVIWYSYQVDRLTQELEAAREFLTDYPYDAYVEKDIEDMCKYKKHCHRKLKELSPK